MPTVQDPEDDLALLVRWRAGDRVAGELLFRRYFDGLHRFFAAKGVDDIEDLIHRTFLAAFEATAAQRPITCVRAWLFGVARHLVLERWRARPDFDPSTSSIAQCGPSASSLFLLDEDRRRLASALWRIPLDDQIVLELHYWESFTSREIAEALEIAEPTARGRLQRARRSLFDAFETSSGKHHDDDGGPGVESWLLAMRPQVPRRPPR